VRVIPLRCKRPVGREDLADYPGIQVMNPSLIAGKAHLEFAVSQAEAAFERGENISANPFVEAMLRASGQRQIQRAFELLGIGDAGESEVVVLAEGDARDFMEAFGCEAAEELLAMDRAKMERIMEAFGISADEISTLPLSEEEAILELVKERIALLNA